MGISTHILDTSRGHPAEGIVVVLEREHEDGFHRAGAGTTDKDGRVKFVDGDVERGIYRLRFALADYFKKTGTKAFFPTAEIIFVVENGSEKFHVPLLLNPFGYSTYRGS